MNKKTITLISIIILFTQSAIWAQAKVEKQQTIYSSRLKQPISIEVINTDREKVVFYANNESYLKYKVTLSFNTLTNLAPRFSSRSFVVDNGRNRLVTFNVENEESPHDYRYTYSYSINPSKLFNERFNYLHPIGENKNLSKYIPIVSNVIYQNQYELSKGDTVYAMRKGMVVADLLENERQDRLSQKKSVEILHSNGTIMIFEGLDNPDKILVTKGKMVYPGQAIAIINQNKTRLKVNLCFIHEDGKIRTKEIKYVDSCEGENILTLDFKKCKTIYPYDIIIKEMTKKEIKRFSKNKLY